MTIPANPTKVRGRFWIRTYGCQMNEHDSEIYAGQLRDLGYEPAAGPDEADVILLNTCSVRERAEEKLFSELGRLRRLRGVGPALDGARDRTIATGPRQPRIGVTGCIAQQRGAGILEREESVDFVLGTRALRALPAVLAAIEEGDGAQVVTEDLIDFEAGDAERGDRVKAYVTIMEGCDNYCSFCIVPATRGMEVYRPAADIIDEVRGLSIRGFREVTLLGQNVNSWVDEGAGVDFPGLLRTLDARLGEEAGRGLARIRFLTSHPKDLSPRLIEALAECPRLAKHIHLPVQSGSDAVLYRMNRHYTGARYLALVDELRAAIPEIGLSTDLIVGFPGETDADFEATLELVRQARYDSFYSFEYSPRPGTAAQRHADEEDEIPAEVRRQRLVRLQEMQRRLQLEKNAAWVGRTVEVLVDGISKRSPDDVSGRLSSNQIVNFPGEEPMIGHLARVAVVGSGPNSLYGELRNLLD